MELSAINDSIISFLKNNILADGVEIQPDTVLRDIGIDSYSIVEIVLFIERKFGFVVPDNDLKPENFGSVDKISSVVHKYLNTN